MACMLETTGTVSALSSPAIMRSTTRLHSMPQARRAPLLGAMSQQHDSVQNMGNLTRMTLKIDCDIEAPTDSDISHTCAGQNAQTGAVLSAPGAKRSRAEDDGLAESAVGSPGPVACSEGAVAAYVDSVLRVYAAAAEASGSMSSCLPLGGSHLPLQHSKMQAWVS